MAPSGGMTPRFSIGTLINVDANAVPSVGTGKVRTELCGVVLGCGLVVFADLAMQRSAAHLEHDSRSSTFLASRVLQPALAITSCGVGPTSPIKSSHLDCSGGNGGRSSSPRISSRLGNILLHIFP